MQNFWWPSQSREVKIMEFLWLLLSNPRHESLAALSNYFPRFSNHCPKQSSERHNCYRQNLFQTKTAISSKSSQCICAAHHEKAGGPTFILRQVCKACSYTTCTATYSHHLKAFSQQKEGCSITPLHRHLYCRVEWCFKFIELGSF